MGERDGIGATIASAVIFSVLLVSNFSVYFAAQQDVRLHMVSNAEDALADWSIVLTGAEAANVLLREQAFLMSTELYCGNASAVVYAEIGALDTTQEAANLTATTRAAPSLQGGMADELPMLASFDSFVTGYLDTSLYTEVRGGDASLGVTYALNETYYVNLPLRLGQLVEDCESALSDIVDAAATTVPGNCTASVMTPLVVGAASEAALVAREAGFEFSVEATVADVDPCTAYVTVMLGQANIMGLGGSFNVSMHEVSLARFA